ncbi:MAG: DDE-type integrase/transposase/recombinase [Pseudomonadota bacterium]
MHHRHEGHEHGYTDRDHSPDNRLFDGRAFRVLTIVDQFSRQSPLLESGISLGGRDVAAALDRAIQCDGTPNAITIDHGTEFTSKALEEWAYRRGVKLDLVQVHLRASGRLSGPLCLGSE